MFRGVETHSQETKNMRMLQVFHDQTLCKKWPQLFLCTQSWMYHTAQTLERSKEWTIIVSYVWWFWWQQQFLCHLSPYFLSTPSQMHLFTRNFPKQWKYTAKMERSAQRQCTTVEPLIRDPQRYRWLLYNGHLLQPHANTLVPPRYEWPLYKGKIVGPIVSLFQRFHCTELYGNTLS